VLLLGAAVFLVPAAAPGQEEGTPAEEEVEKEESREQEQEQDWVTEIVVTATRYPKPASESPGSVDVVRRTEIEGRHVYGADEAIKFCPGVHDQRRKGPADIMPSFYIRGFKSDTRCLVLVDGAVRRDWLYVPVAAIERIEVAKGPFSALYGDKAMGGVVNVITRTPEERICEVTGGMESNDTRTVGLVFGDKVGRSDFLLTVNRRESEGYVSNYYVRSEYTGGTLPIATVSGWEETTDKYGNTRFLVGDKGRNWTEGEHYGLNLGYDVSEGGRVGVQLYYRDYAYGYRGGESHLRDVATGDVIYSGVVDLNDGSGRRVSVSSSGFESSYGGEPCYGLAVSYDQTVGERTELSVKLGWDTEDHWYASETAKYSTTPSDRFWTGLQSVTRLPRRHVLTAGIDYRMEETDFENWALSDWEDIHSRTKLNYSMRGDVNTVGVYVQDEWEISDEVSLFFGGRFDSWRVEDGKHEFWNSGTSSYVTEDFPRQSENTFSPKAAAVYRPNQKTVLRGSVGTAFRGPESVDLYKDWLYGSKLYRGNPDLEPERNFAWELGVEQEAWKGAKVKATYFSNRMDDYIARRDYDAAEVAAYNAAHGTAFTAITQYDNVAEAKSAGVEFGLEQKLPHGFSAFVTYTYNKTEVLDNPASPDSEGEQLTYVPEDLFGVGLGYRREFTDKSALSMVLTGRYVDKVYTADDNSDTEEGVFGGYDSFFVTDFKLSYDAGEKYRLSFTVNNAFDEEYFQYYEAPGRTLGLEFTARF